MKRFVIAHPFVPTGKELDERCKEIFGIQTCALAKRVEQLPSKEVYIGVSGGLDSTLALLVVVKAYDMLGWDRKHIHGITMSRFGTTDETQKNAIKLMEALGISMETISIGELAMMAFKALGHKPFGIETSWETTKSVGYNTSQSLDFTLQTFLAKLQEIPEGAEDLVFENVQARLRTFVLMSRGFVLGTGDLSEIALGWCTYNGDQQSMYNVNCSVPKTLVKFLVQYIAKMEYSYLSGDLEKSFIPGVYDVLMAIVNTVISPELLPTKNGEIVQSTEAKIGPYELHDFFLYHFMRNGFAPKKILYLAKNAKFDVEYTDEVLRKWLKVFFTRFFHNQFKRQAVPDGPKVGSVSLDPRGDWRMPSDAAVDLWIKELE